MPGGQKGPGEDGLDMEGVEGGDFAALLEKNPEAAMKALERSGTGATLAADSSGRLLLPADPAAALDGVTQVIRSRMEGGQTSSDAPVEVPEEALEAIEAGEAPAAPATPDFTVAGKPGTGQTMDFFKAGDEGTYRGGPNDPELKEPDPFE